jgi:magnesium-transporting ATPase (P-type)
MLTRLMSAVSAAAALTAVSAWAQNAPDALSYQIQYALKAVPGYGVFDYLTFGALLWILNASPEQFRTGWFVESVISASAIVLVIRTRRTFFSSRPGPYLALATLAVAVVTLLLPILPIAPLLGLSPMPPSFLVLLAAILVGYVLAAELVKRRFYAGRRD